LSRILRDYVYVNSKIFDSKSSFFALHWHYISTFKVKINTNVIPHSKATGAATQAGKFPTTARRDRLGQHRGKLSGLVHPEEHPAKLAGQWRYAVLAG
jgi:hypothetical protein